MWNIWKKQNANCNRVLEHLEEYSIANRKEVTVESLLDSLPQEHRDHSMSCLSCRTALQDFVTVRQMLADVPSYANSEAPSFSARVMSAIAAKEYEILQPLSISAIFPRLAARLTWVTSVVLLITSAFLFQRPVMPPAKEPAAASAQDSLFETTQIPSERDDILLSLAERKP